jgi:hypothetical protein
MSLVGYDLDGTLDGREDLTGCVVISGRTFAEYDQLAKSLAARVPVYIRGSGAYGDRREAAEFKAMMIRSLGVTEYHEDDLFQAEIIQALVPSVTLVLHG